MLLITLYSGINQGVNDMPMHLIIDSIFSGEYTIYDLINTGSRFYTYN